MSAVVSAAAAAAAAATPTKRTSPVVSQPVFLKVKRTRDLAFPAPDRIVLVSGDDSKRARNVCLLVGQGLAPSVLMEKARDAGLKRPAADVAAVERNRSAKQPRVIDVAPHEEEFDEPMDAAIWTALSAGDFAPVIALIEAGHDPNTQRIKSPDRATALIAASRHGHLKAVERLLELGADPELKDGYGIPPIEHAAAFPVIQQRLREAVDKTVFDLYAVQAEQVLDSTLLRTVVPSGEESLHLDPVTGEFLEIVHDATDSDFGENDEDSDSNEEDYFFKKLDDDDECEDDDVEGDEFGDKMFCEKCEDEDADSREGLY